MRLRTICALVLLRLVVNCGHLKDHLCFGNTSMKFQAPLFKFHLSISYTSVLQVKCDQYWPTRGTETYALIQVTLLDTVELATYCVRTFALFKVSSIQRPLSSTGYWGESVTNLPPFRMARVRRERWGSSSSQPGQTTGSRSILLHSWPSWDGWKLAILQMLGPWWCTAGMT